jgi:murein DD-endopeptidase MepM/ murein hydrolase activator NlpD
VRSAVLAFLLPLLIPSTIASPAAAVAPLWAAATPTTSRTLGWPLRGPIVRGYEQPANPYASGHRGIDIGAPVGTQVKASADGVVHFAGKVAGSLFVSIDHDGGMQTTYSWVSEVDTRKGAQVHKGDVIALSGTGHPGSSEPTHLHFGVKLDGDYVDPMQYLGSVDVAELIHLAPLAA